MGRRGPHPILLMLLPLDLSRPFDELFCLVPYPPPESCFVLVCVSVPSAPADVKAVTSSETSVIVSWKSPALPNGIIQRYTVHRRQVLNGQEVGTTGSAGTRKFQP